MSSRPIRSSRKEKFYSVNVDSFIERLKKIRALNCSPSDVGIDNYLWKRISGSSSIATKVL